MDGLQNSSWLGWYDLLEKLASVKKCQKTACRTLHALIRNAGMCSPIDLDTAEITIKRLKPLGVFRAYWPFLRMQTWTLHLLEQYPEILLAGCKLFEEASWGMLFHSFWSKYRSIDPTHDLFRTAYDWKTCIPYCFHGDEGRGTGKVPFLVLSFQPIISHKGMDICNDSSYFGVREQYFCTLKLEWYGSKTYDFLVTLIILPSFYAQAFLHNPTFADVHTIQVVLQGGNHR